MGPLRRAAHDAHTYISVGASPSGGGAELKFVFSVDLARSMWLRFVVPTVVLCVILVLGLRYSAHAVPPTALAPALSLGAGAPDIAFDPSTGTGLAAYLGPAGPNRVAILGQRVDSSGRSLGPPVELSTTEEGLQAGRPRIVFNATMKEYLAVWLVGPPQSLQRLARGRRLSGDGIPLGKSDFSVGGEPVVTGSSPGLVAGNGYLVALSAPDTTIHANTLDGHARVIASEKISQREGCGNPTGAFRSAANEYLVGWSCGLPAVAGQQPQTQYVQRVASSGTEIGPDVPILSPRYTVRGSGELALAYNSRSDEFLLVGQARRRIRSRRLRGDGRPLGSVRTLRRVSVKFEARYPTVGFDPRAGRYLVVWTADRQRGRRGVSETLFASRVDQRGIERKPESARRGGIVASIASRGGRGGFLITFYDGRRNAGLIRHVSR